ncbi:uncharacterized protein LOC141526577 isoform X2 [Cotesia typhae]|uniref:uncharacterized protein LOC141526577 isoform X2 n=1 Tax=Cotesia typhae TaxID=2053667 RepID=UPI003D6884B4
MSSKVKYHIRNHRLKFIDRVVDGFAYYSYNTTGNISYIRCYERRSKACHARGKMQNGIPVLSTGHNHDKNPLLQNYCIFQDALFTAATARPYRSLRTIYDHFSVRHHEAAVQFTWAKMQPLMESWRRRERPRHPPIPTNLQQFADFLNMPQWASLLSYPQGQLSISTLATPDGSFLTVLYDLNFVQSVTGITTLFMDGTFKITPKKPNIFQVFTILGLINDNKFFQQQTLWTKLPRHYTIKFFYFMSEFSITLFSW